MSYILDALRRAEAERERGGVPGLHAQTVAGMPAAGDARAPMPPWVWLAAGGAIALAGVLAWTFLGRASTPAAVLAPPPAPMSSAPANAAVAAASPAPTPAPAPAPVVTTAAAPAPASPPPAVVTPGVPVVQTLPPPRPAASEAAPPVRVYAMNELPEDVRRQLPAISIGGSIHSPDPASRVLIINGQLFHEKDKVAPELTLLQIHLKEAVLQFRDWRVKLAF